MIEVTIKRSKDDVKGALVQFCARRGYRLSDPWYLEGLRIEIPKRTRDEVNKRGFWATVTDAPTMPRVDVDIKKKRANSSRMKLSFSDHSESIRLAYELQAYLNDDRAYEPACPPICSSCGNSVPNPTAHYCGRCGFQFVADGVNGAQPILRPPPVVAVSSRSLERETPSVMIEREDRRVAPREDAAESQRDSTAADDAEIEAPEPEADEPALVGDDDAARIEASSPDDEVSGADAEESIAAPQEGETGERAAEAIAVEDEDAVADGEDSENKATDEDDDASAEADDQPEADRDDAPRTSRRLLAEE